MTAAEFINNLPNQVSSEQIVDKESLFHFHLKGDGGGDFTVKIADEKVEVVEGFQGDPKCEVKASAENFMRVINGDLKPVMAILFGKVKVSNQNELIKYAKVFGLMK